MLSLPITPTERPTAPMVTCGLSIPTDPGRPPPVCPPPVGAPVVVELAAILALAALLVVRVTPLSVVLRRIVRRVVPLVSAGPFSTRVMVLLAR